MANLLSISQLAILDSLAPRTRSSYWTAWNSFRSFHSLLGLQFPSFDVLTLSSFVSYAFTYQSLAIRSIKAYLSGISFFSKAYTGMPLAETTLTQLTLILKGFRRRAPPVIRRRLPLTSDLLHRCIATLRSSHLSWHVSRTLESMFLLAFFGFLRCSEFAPPTATHNPSCHPCIGDIQAVSDSCLAFHLKCSKTNHSGVSVPIFLFKLQSFLSPYEPLANYIQYRVSCGASSSDPLFITESRRTATRSWFIPLFKFILERSNICPDFFSGHSFRIGAATSAASRGIPDRLIKTMGRWSSSAFEIYTHHHLGDLQSAQAALLF